MVSLELATQTKEIELHKKSLISFILPTIIQRRTDLKTIAHSLWHSLTLHISHVFFVLHYVTNVLGRP